MQKVISYEFDKGPKFAPEIAKEDTDLTVEMLARWVSSIWAEQRSLICLAALGRRPI
jgi:hypothetical protein